MPFLLFGVVDQHFDNSQTKAARRFMGLKRMDCWNPAGFCAVAVGTIYGVRPVLERWLALSRPLVDLVDGQLGAVPHIRTGRSAAARDRDDHAKLDRARVACAVTPLPPLPSTPPLQAEVVSITAVAMPSSIAPRFPNFMSASPLMVTIREPILYDIAHTAPPTS